MDIENLEVAHNETEKRFEVRLDDQLALIEYQRAGNNIIFTHTEVPEAFEGRGIANRIAQVALDYAQAQGFKIQPVCPFVVAYIEKHPEYQTNTWGY